MPLSLVSYEEHKLFYRLRQSDGITSRRKAAPHSEKKTLSLQMCFSPVLTATVWQLRLFLAVTGCGSVGECGRLWQLAFRCTIMQLYLITYLLCSCLRIRLRKQVLSWRTEGSGSVTTNVRFGSGFFLLFLHQIFSPVRFRFYSHL